MTSQNQNEQILTDENKAIIKNVIRVAKIDYGLEITAHEIIWGLQLLKIVKAKAKELNEMDNEEYAVFNPDLEDFLEELLEEAEDKTHVFSNDIQNRMSTEDKS